MFPHCWNLTIKTSQWHLLSRAIATRMCIILFLTLFFTMKGGCHLLVDSAGVDFGWFHLFLLSPFIIFG